LNGPEIAIGDAVCAMTTRGANAAAAVATMKWRRFRDMAFS
jgi:hypothetical protein